MCSKHSDSGHQGVHFYEGFKIGSAVLADSFDLHGLKYPVN